MPACEILPKGCRFSPMPLLLIKPGRSLIHLAGRGVGGDGAFVPIADLYANRSEGPLL